MKVDIKALLAAAGIAAIAFSPAYATEGGDQATKPGAFIGSSAGVPPPGIYMFNQVFTYQANLVGPGTTNALGNAPGQHTGVQAAVDVQGFLFVPGWTFLGATYDAVLVQPFIQQSVGSPINAQASGMFNTYIVPVELSWRLGASGFAVKTGLGIYLADGTSTGINGLGNVANPYYTFQPELILSYLKDGWNLSVAMYDEINTENQVTHYTTGNIFHADFTATKTIGKWTFGPVAYYVGQVSNDSCGPRLYWQHLRSMFRIIRPGQSALCWDMISDRRASRFGRRRRYIRRVPMPLLQRILLWSPKEQPFSRRSAIAFGRLRSRRRPRCSTNNDVLT